MEVKVLELVLVFLEGRLALLVLLVTFEVEEMVDSLQLVVLGLLDALVDLVGARLVKTDQELGVVESDRRFSCPSVDGSRRSVFDFGSAFGLLVLL